MIDEHITVLVNLSERGQGDTMLELAEAVVVGGGVMGAAITAALSRRFSRVLLIEADRFGGRATADGFAWVNASSKWQDESYHRLNAESCERHRMLAAEWTAARTGWRAGGTLYWVSKADDVSSNPLVARSDILQAWGYPVVRLAPGEMRALEPNVQFDEDTFGLFAPSEGWVATARLVAFFIEQARQQSGFLSDYTRVTGFTRDYTGRIATVETDRGRVSTRLVVLCAGIETAGLAALAAGLPQERFSAIINRSPGLLAETSLQPDPRRIYRVCYPPDKAGLHFRPTLDSGILLGADDTDAACADTESEGAAPHRGQHAPSWTDLGKRLHARASRVLPALDPDGSVTTHRCIRPMPADGLPIVGALPGVSGVYLLVSHSGVTLAPLLSQLLADEIVTGRPSPVLAPYRPDRFL